MDAAILNVIFRFQWKSPVKTKDHTININVCCMLVSAAARMGFKSLGLIVQTSVERQR